MRVEGGGRACAPWEAVRLHNTLSQAGGEEGGEAADVGLLKQLIAVLHLGGDFGNFKLVLRPAGC